MNGGEGDAEARVLHADFEGHALALGEVHAGPLGDEEAEEHAEGVVQDDCDEDQEAGVHQLLTGGGRDGSGDQHDGENRDERQGCEGGVDAGAEELVDEHAGGDRQKDDLDDRHEHRGRIDRKPLAGEEIHQRGRHDGGEERRAGRDGDREGDVAAGKEGHDVGRRAARTATQKHQADGDVGRQIQRIAEQERATGHDRELGEDAEEDVAGTAEDFTEVRGREREAHAEHHHAEQRSDPGTNLLENLRKNEAGNAENDDPEGERLVNELAHFCEDFHHDLRRLRLIRSGRSMWRRGEKRISWFPSGPLARSGFRGDPGAAGGKKVVGVGMIPIYPKENPPSLGRIA